MSERSEALRLADALEISSNHGIRREAAAELRRLHEENAELRKANDAFGQRQEWWNERMVALEAQRDALRAELKEATEAINDPAVNNLRTLAESIRMLCAQRDALLEALKEIVAATDSDEWNPVSTWRARAAIKAVEEKK